MPGARAGGLPLVGAVLGLCVGGPVSRYQPIRRLHFHHRPITGGHSGRGQARRRGGHWRLHPGLHRGEHHQGAAGDEEAADLAIWPPAAPKVTVTTHRQSLSLILFSLVCTSHLQGAGPASSAASSVEADKKPKRTRVRRRKPPPKVVEETQSESDEAVSLPAVYPPHLHR